MISEELDFQFDVEKLRAHVVEKVLPLTPHMVGQFFGGWSVTSSTGSYLDGWASGERAFEPTFMPGSTMEEKLAALGVKRASGYVTPTEICTGYLSEVMQSIRDAGLTPMRARLSLLKGGGRSSLHRDGKDSEYSVRLHVPIITSEQCLFSCEEGAVHLPANGRAHLLRVNRMHQVFNGGEADRIHLIMSVIDTAGVSKFHRRA